MTRIFSPRLFLLLLSLLPLAAIAPAAAQPRAAASAPADTSQLTAAQARQALETLNDPARRAQLITVLEALAKAAPAAAPAAPPPAAAPTAPAPTTPAAAPAPVAPAALPLAPDSLGAQLLVGASDRVSQLTASAVDAFRAVTDFPLIGRWVTQLTADPIARRLLIDVSLKLVAVMALGLLAEWGAARLLRRPVQALGRRAPAPQRPAPEIEGLAEAERGQTERQGAERFRPRLSGTLLVARRLPFALACFALHLLPVLAVLAVGYATLALGLGSQPITRLVILAALNAYVLFRVVMGLTILLCAPDSRRLRLLPLSDAAAAYVCLWARRIAAIAIFGYAATETGLLFGLYRAAHDALVKLIGLAVMVCLVVIVLQLRATIAAILAVPPTPGPDAPQPQGEPRRRGLAAQLRAGLAPIWHIAAIFYIAAIWVVWALEMPDGFSRLLRGVVITGAVLAAAWAVNRLALDLLARLFTAFAGMLGEATTPQGTPLGWGTRIRNYHPVAQALLRTLLRALTVLVLLEAWGIPALSWFAGGLGGRLVGSLSTIAIAMLAALVVWEAATAAMQGHIDRLAENRQAQRAARLRTLLPMLRTTLLVAISLVVGLTVLSEIGLNIAPLLAGAGVIGLAIGFGSQKLVQDIITGLFLLLENTMQVGDYVTLGGLSGTVEALSIRTIRLRATDGAVHIVPFSAVTTVSNATRDFSFVVADVQVGLNEDPDRIVELLRAIADEMRADPAFALTMTSPLEIWGLDKFVPQGFVLRMRLRTVPGQSGAVGREFNRRIKHRFDELAIQSPMTSYRALAAAMLPAPDAEPAPPQPT